MATIDADALVEVLDRHIAFLREQEPPSRRLLLLPRLLNFVENEPSLGGLVAELRSEADEMCREFVERDRELRQHLRTLWAEHGAEIRSFLNTQPPDEPLGELCPLESYETELSKALPISPSNVEGAAGDAIGTKNLIDAFEQWLTYVPRERGSPTRQVAIELERRLSHLHLLHEHNLQRAKGAECQHAGFAFLCLREATVRTTPEPPHEREASVYEQRRFYENKYFAEAVRTPHRSDPMSEASRDVSRTLREVERNVRLLHEELRARLLLSRSRIALVRRYAARCETFEAKRLRKLAAGNHRRAEQKLTLDFARFLFDQGLDPLIDPSIGGLKPDILDLSRSAVFYVEAKQYDEDIREASVRSAVLKAWRQVWSTWHRLQGQHLVPEAFLVVFRRGGPPAAFPPVVPWRGLRLYPVLIDLAESVGSAEKYAPVQITEEDLLPEEATSLNHDASLNSAPITPSPAVVSASTASGAKPARPKRATSRNVQKTPRKGAASKR